jgi:hypothetical protein
MIVKLSAEFEVNDKRTIDGLREDFKTILDLAKIRYCGVDCEKVRD